MQLMAAAAAAAMLISTQSGYAAGPISVANVAAGQVQFAHSGATTIIHASNNAIINYRQFDIPAGQAVDFVQPNASSRVLNRVITNIPSQIDGALRANGVVYLVNPAGVIFGPHSVVNVGDLYAAAGHLSNANFLAGVDHFTDLSGNIANAGNISAGAVSLLGASVINSGSITAPDGSIVLASAHDVYLTRIGGLITAKLSDAAAEPASHGIAMQSKIPAAAIQAVNQSDQLVCAGSELALGIINSGTLRAAQINLQAAGTKSVALVSGRVDASTRVAGQRGGNVSIQAGHIAVGYTPDASGVLSAAPADVTADGPAGGGKILIGAAPSVASAGGYQDTALTNRISGQTIIDASATVAGSGGLIDTSGQWLSIAAGAAVSSGGAGGGRAGLWQLDPANVVISANSPSGYTALTPSSSKPLTYAATSGTSSYWVDVSNIISALAGNTVHANSGTNVSITAAGLLEVDSEINPDIVSTNAESLTLKGGSIQINSPIEPTGNSSTLTIQLQSTAGSIGINAGVGLSNNPVESLTVDAVSGQTINLAASVYTSGQGQSYQGSINLGPGAVTLQENAGPNNSLGNIIIGAPGDTLTNSYNNSSANPTTLTVLSSGGYIAENASITPTNLSKINLNMSAGGASGSGQAIVFAAPIQTGGGYFNATSSGGGNLTVMGSAGSGSSAPGAIINTAGGNATFTASGGGKINLTGGDGGGVPGGDALDTGSGNFAVTASGTSTVKITGGAGGAAGSSASGAVGGAGVSTGGSVIIGSSGSPVASLTISGGAGGNGSGSYIGGNGGAGIRSSAGAIDLYYSGNSSLSVGAIGSSGGGLGGAPISTVSSNLQLNPSGSGAPVMALSAPSASGVPVFESGGSFTFGTGGTLQLTGTISTRNGLILNGPAVAVNAATLTDNSSAGIDINGAISGSSGSLTINEINSGAITLPQSVTIGSLVVNGSLSKVQFSGNGSVATTGGQTFDAPINVASGQSINLTDDSTNGVVLGVINGTGSLAVDEQGSGTVNLGGTIGAFSGVVPALPTLGSLSVTDATGPVAIDTGVINVGQLSLSSGALSNPLTNGTGSSVVIYSPTQSYTASGSGASLGLLAQRIECFGTSASTPATSLSLKQSASIADSILPIYSADSLSLESTNGNVILNGGLDVPGTTALILTSDSGYVTVGAAASVNVKSLAVNADTAINISNSVTTSGGQFYQGVGANTPAINLPASGQITLDDASAAGITLQGAAINGSGSSVSLDESGTGQVKILSPVGNSALPLSSLAVTSSTGGIDLGATDIFSTTSQTYTGPVSLTGAAAFNGGTGSVTFDKSVSTGTYNLAVSAGAINLNGGSITGTGNQTYTGSININAANTLQGGAMTFTGTLSSGNSSNLTVNAGGNVNFSGGSQQLFFGGLGTLTVQSAGTITIGGNLTAQSIAFNSSDSVPDAISFGGSSSFILAANTQSFTASGPSGTLGLQSSNAEFTGYPANSNSFFLSVNNLPSSFSIAQASEVTDSNLPTLNQFITVDSVLGTPSITHVTSLNHMPYNITYTGPQSASSPVIALNGQNDLTGADLSVSAANSEVVLGSSGNSLNLGSLSANGIVEVDGSIVTGGSAAAAQTYDGSLVPGGSAQLENTGPGAININASILPASSSSALTIIADGGGAINLRNNIGSSNQPLDALTINTSNGSTLNLNDNQIFTSLGQTYNGAVNVGGLSTLTDAGAAGSAGIRIIGPVTGTTGLLNLVEEGSGIPVNLGSAGQSIGVKSLSVTTDPGEIDLDGGTIQTTAGQSYTGTLNVLAPTTLQDSSGGTLSFQGITGPSILTVMAPTDSVALTMAITPAGIRITGQTIQLPIGSAISTSLGQVLSGTTLLSGNTTLTDSGAAGSAGIQLLGNINQPGDALTLNQAGGVDGLIGSGLASHFVLGGFNIDQGTILSQLGTLNLASTINNSGDLSLINSLLYTNSSGPLTLAGKIDLQNGSTLTAEPAGGTATNDVISNASIGSLADSGNVTIEGANVTINGSIRANGQVLLQDNNQLAVGPFGITNFDFRPTSLLAVNNDISGGTVLLNPDSPLVPGIGVAVPDAATMASTGPAAITISGGVVSMGRDQKWTSLGSLAITGSTVNLGDLNVLGNLSVTAPTINMLTRGFGSLLIPQGLHANSATKPDGVDVVAGNIVFSTMPTPLPAAAPGGPPYPQFATPTGGGNIPGYTIHVFKAGVGGLTAADLYSTVVSPGITSSQKYYLDLQASGPVTTNVFDSFTAFAIPQIPQVKTDVTLSSSQRAVLRSAGINAKNPTLADLLALSDGRAVFNDLPQSGGLILENPSLIDYYVTTSRLPYHRTLAFIALYKRLFLAPVINPKTGKPVKNAIGLPEFKSRRNLIHQQFNRAWAAYVAQAHKQRGARPSAMGFRRYLLHSRSQTGAAANLRRISALIYEAYLLGLSPKAMRLSTSTILAELSPEALSSHQFEKVILGPRIGLVTGTEPR